MGATHGVADPGAVIVDEVVGPEYRLVGPLVAGGTVVEGYGAAD